MDVVLQKVNDIAWGLPTMLLILLVGGMLTFRTGFAQITWLPRAFKEFFRRFQKRKNYSGTSSYQALCTALAATVGTGNLAGVAGAIAIGGPGAVFWMWVCAFFGMIIKFAEAALAIRFRHRSASGEFFAGPMYMIRFGMDKKWHFLASVYSFFGVVAAFGVGNATQINTVIAGVNSVLESFGCNGSAWLDMLIGLLLAALIGLMLYGGAKRIGKIAERLVPFAAVLYITLGLGVLIVCREAIPKALQMIIRGAFSPAAVTGGAVGSVMSVIRIGASRGIFTNEAGMGTAAIAHGTASVEHPVQQGFMGIIEVFLDTIVICTVTSLVILCSGVRIPFGTDAGINLTNSAFSAIYGSWVRIPIALSLCCFAVATVLGWGLYGIRCAQYLFGQRAWKWFVTLQVATVIVGAVLKSGTVWLLADTFNALMSVPNLIGLVALSPQLIELMDTYRRKENIL